MTETITFNNRTFPVRTVDIPRYGSNLTIGTVELNEQLMDKEGRNPVSKEAETLDQSIFFYVDEQEIEMPENELVEVILYHLQ
jgi:hypothetical protein